MHDFSATPVLFFGTIISLCVLNYYDFEKFHIVRSYCFLLRFSILTRDIDIAILPPFTSAWPHLRCDVGLEEGDIEKTVSVLQYCVLL